MTTPTIPAARKPACKLTFQVQRAPYFLCVAIKGEASFDQAEAISAQLPAPLGTAFHWSSWTWPS